MTDPLLDDVKALLDKDFGDDRILKQICRACENDEVISNYERNYVKKLAEKYLGRRPENIIPKQELEKPQIPDVHIPETTNQQTQSYQHPNPPRVSSRNSKNTKIMLGIGGIILIAIIALAVSFNGATTTNSPTTELPSTEPGTLTLSVQTDLSSYNKLDLISISGTSDISGSVNLSIKNQNNQVVWTEQISVKNDGGFSTLTIAGGQGWENSGTYTIVVENDREMKSSIFSFST